MLITEELPMKYLVVVNGTPISNPQASRSLAEAIVLQLPADQRMVAEIRSVTTDGRQLLLG